jgi:hypothetical protein
MSPRGGTRRSDPSVPLCACDDYAGSPARLQDEIDRIIEEYVGDALAELGLIRPEVPLDDLKWVRVYASGSLHEIEKATLCLVAFHHSKNLSSAPDRLGMAAVSLSPGSVGVHRGHERNAHRRGELGGGLALPGPSRQMLAPHCGQRRICWSANVPQ